MLKQEKIQSLIDQLDVEIKNIPTLFHDRSQAILAKFTDSGLLRSNRTLLSLKQGLVDLVEEKINFVWQNLGDLLEHDSPDYSKEMNAEIKGFLKQSPYLQKVQESARENLAHYKPNFKHSKEMLWLALDEEIAAIWTRVFTDIDKFCGRMRAQHRNFVFKRIGVILVIAGIAAAAISTCSTSLG